MNEDGQPPDFAEIWVSANRTRALNLAQLFATTAAALKQRWKSRQQRTAPERAGQHPLSKAANDAA